MHKKIMMITIAAIAIVALTFGLSTFAAGCGDDDAASSGRVAQMRGDRQVDGAGCQSAAQGCGSGSECSRAAGSGTCDGTCDGSCDGSASCDGDCAGGTTCAGSSACPGGATCASCTATETESPFGSEPLCF